MRSVCVFCGSSVGTDPAFAAAATALGRELARRGIGLVYGGGSIGLMGLVADAVLDAGGTVTGVIPRGLARREWLHARVADMHVVASMHERKALMESLAGGFIALPGGLGTFEELLEMMTWGQLGIHRKPLGVLDVNGYWAGLWRLLDDSVTGGFVDAENAAMLLRADDAAALLDRMAAWRPRPGKRPWLEPAES